VVTNDEATSTDPSAAPDPSSVDGTNSGRAFSDRVLMLFATRVFTAGMAIFNGFLLARALGPSAKGDYYLVTLLPATIMTFIQFGLPSAFSYFAARGLVDGIISRTVFLTVALVGPALLLVILLLPVLQATIVEGPDANLILFCLLALPLMLHATFTTAIVIGRQAVSWASAVYVVVAISTTVLLVLLVVILDLGLNGALLAYVLNTAIVAGGFLIGARRTATRPPISGSVAYRALFGFGLRLYPGNLSHFLTGRIDVYLIAWLMTSPSAPLGYYSMGVSMAELVLFFPTVVSTLFFPHVSRASREDADRQVPRVTRVTLLLTACVAVAMVPVATLLIVVLIPAFTPALPALYVLLPGVAALSVSEVLGGYAMGLGRTTTTSVVSIAVLIVNVVLNLVLIPQFGIVGAALASLFAYSVAAVTFSIIAARLADTPLRDFWIPRPDDVRFVVSNLTALAGRVTGRRLT
jgi:O-antigen/teichoic acid export membrane protein